MGTQVVRRLCNSLMPAEPSVSFWCTVERSVMTLMEFWYSSTTGGFLHQDSDPGTKLSYICFLFLLPLLVEILAPLIHY